MKAILRSINNFSCKLKQSNNLKYNISPKIRSNKFKSISGSGNVVIEDALNKDLKDYRVYGNTVQSKLPSGYTQVDYIESSGTQYIDTGWYPDYSKKIEIEATINPQVSNKRYCILSNYLNTSEYNLSLETNINNKVRFYINSSITNDLISSNTIETNKFTTIKFNYNENDSKYSILMNGISSEKTTNVSKEKLSLSTYLFLDQGHRVTVFNNSLQLKRISIKENDKLIRDFVPCYRNSDNEVGLYDIVNNVFYTNQGTGTFTYGSVVPTPDTPIEMVSCGDRTKNLFDKNNATILNAYIGASNSTITSLISYRTTYLKVKPNTYYTVSKNSSNDLRIGLSTNNSVDIGDILTNVARTTTDNKLTILTNNDTKTLAITYAYTTVDDEVKELNSLMVEEGSTATSYEPYYEGYKIPVNVRSENLLNTLEINETIDRTLTYKSNTKGELIINGTAFNGNIDFKTNLNKKLNGDYTFIFKKISGSIINDSKVINHRFSIGNSENPGAASVNGRLLTNIFNSSSDVVIVTGNINDIVDKFSIYFNMGCIFNNYTFQIYLVKGIYTTSNLPTYQPYYSETTNIYLDEPLRKSDDGTYVDHIDFQNKKVYRQIKEITLNGTEAWSRVSAKNSHYRFRVNRSDLKIGAECVLYCTHFKNNGDSYSHEGISGSTGNILYIRWDELFETVDDLKTWLASNTPIVDYVLEAPTEEDIELPNIKLIEGKNIITVGTEVQGVFEVEYYSKEIIDISDYKYNLRKVED